MTTPDEKYIVFKREDWAEFVDLRKAQGLTKAFENRSVPDAVVIRTQDVFAGPGLHAYANNIMSTLEVFDRLDVIVGGDAISQMKKTMNYFIERAFEADKIASECRAKLPD